VSLGLATVIVLHWYLGRRLGWPSLGLEGTLLATVAVVGGFLALGVYRDHRSRASAGPPPPGVDV
jgi:hypothetical protein